MHVDFRNDKAMHSLSKNTAAITAIKSTTTNTTPMRNAERVYDEFANVFRYIIFLAMLNWNLKNQHPDMNS